MVLKFRPIDCLVIRFNTLIIIDSIKNVYTSKNNFISNIFDEKYKRVENMIKKKKKKI